MKELSKQRYPLGWTLIGLFSAQFALACLFVGYVLMAVGVTSFDATMKFVGIVTFIAGFGFFYLMVASIKKVLGLKKTGFIDTLVHILMLWIGQKLANNDEARKQPQQNITVEVRRRRLK